ncbi:hypothetical protein COU80_03835 [Candidatus Peregrinibacteria bacterium CG10_big_fil_rev_8_21_14_0_10_55_24]|nr:MAG: hypothetical protein COU80_03835 [Candidatus Peregrinibacteria bacterium CG10_big_fil_rev_8_21_14_0_10_55_24]
MTPLSPTALAAFRAMAQDGTETFGDELDTVLREQCATPEFAGGSVADFLNGLPRFTTPGKATAAIDACYAERMMGETKRILAAIVAEDKHMADMLQRAQGPDVDISASVDRDDPSSQKLDDYIRRTTGGDQKAVDNAIRNEGMAADREIEASFREGFTGRGEGLFDYSRFPPALCYQQATRDLIHGVIVACAGGGGTRSFPRLEPLIEGEVLTAEKIARMVKTIQQLVGSLRYGSDEEVHSRED